MLHKWVREYLRKYSFVTATEFKGAILYIYYKHDNKLKKKKLPFRATKNQLVRCIERIKEEISYYEKREKDIKEGKYDVKKQDFIFAYTSEKGEKNG